MRLLGFCAPEASSEWYLVYELASFGALDVALRHDARAEKLTWRVRVRLLSGVAKALHFMHRGGGGARCFHRDVKAANVVLTAALEPKLIDCPRRESNSAVIYVSAAEAICSFRLPADEEFLIDYGKYYWGLD